MSLVSKIELASDIHSIASGRVPASLGMRLVPLFFGRRKGMSKAKWKKLMMRKRRMFVDTIVMNHKRAHDKSREKTIEEAKAKISNKPQKSLDRPSSSPKLSKRKSPDMNDRKWRDKAGPNREQKSRIRGLVDNERGHTRSKWAMKVNEKTGAKKEI
ncbi:MAG: hypothetical protein K0R25_1371 [Rickettsiaceae bacterium]|jgi:hypothetical protein|nr:hypothetical protein [Rickettsiaceae bacterium]